LCLDFKLIPISMIHGLKGIDLRIASSDDMTLDSRLKQTCLKLKQQLASKF